AKSSVRVRLAEFVRVQVIRSPTTSATRKKVPRAQQLLLLFQLFAIRFSLLIEFQGGAGFLDLFLSGRLAVARQVDRLPLPLAGFFGIAGLGVSGGKRVDDVPFLPPAQLVSLIRVPEGRLAVTIPRVGASCL